MENMYRILHFAYVYKNIDNQMKFLKTLDDKLEFSFREIIDGPILYKGKDSKLSLKVAVTQLFGINLDIIQWIDGECPMKDFLEQGKEGLHHIAVYDDDVQSRVKEYQDKGIEILLKGQMGDFEVNYMDTKKIFGVIIELFGPRKK